MENEINEQINEQINQQVQPGVQREADLKINAYEDPITHKFEVDDRHPDLQLQTGIMALEKSFQNEAKAAGKKTKALRGSQLYKQHVDDVDKNIEQLKELAQRDSLKAYLDEKTKKNLDSSGWLSKQAFPSEEDLNKEMDKAAEKVFGSAAVSKSQRTKRGQKFKEKAKLQAKMMNELNAYIWKREAAMDTVLKIGRDSSLVQDLTAEAIQSDTEGELEKIGRSMTSFSFFHQFSGDLENNIRFGVMAKDMAMFGLLKDDSVLEKEKRNEFHKKAKETAQLLSNMYNKKETYQEQAIKILQDFKDLDLKQFDYKSNEDFLTGEGQKSFAGRFAALRMYSHSLTLLIDLKDNAAAFAKLTGETDPESKKAKMAAQKMYEELRVKAELVREIAQDYESRALMIQSPYFALLASKDADDLSIEDLEKRRDTTEDEPARMYLTELIHQRRRKGFGRGKSAAAIYKERLAEARKKKQEETGETLQHTKEAETYETDNVRERLEQSTKRFGDSSLMKAVKRDFSRLEDLENTQVTAENYIAKGELLAMACRKAIESCDAYLAERKGSSKTAKERRELVESARTRCVNNLKALSTAEMLSGTEWLTFIKGKTNLSTIMFQATWAQMFENRKKTAMERERTAFAESAALTEFAGLFTPDTKTVRKGKEAKQYADEIGRLRAELKSIPQGRAFSVYTKIDGIPIVFAQDDLGGLTVHYGESKVHVQESVSDFIHLLDHKMIEEQDQMNPQDMEAVIADQNVNIELIIHQKDKDNLTLKEIQKSAGDIQRASTNLARFLELRTGKAAVFFSNLEPDLLRWFAIDLIRGADPEVVAKQVERAAAMAEKKTLNTIETLQLIKEVEKKKTEVEEKVVYHREEREEEQRGWAPEEAQAIDFLSDLIFSQETWQADETLNDPGERLRLMLEKHMDIFARILFESRNPFQPGLIMQVANKLPKEVSGLMMLIFEPMQTFLVSLSMMTGKGTDLNGLKQELKTLFSQKNENLMNVLKNLDAGLEEKVQASMDKIQDTIKRKTDTLFKPKTRQDDRPNEQQNEAQQPVEQNRVLTKQEKEERLKRQEQQLKDIMQESMKGNKGQGLFIKLIFLNYFKGAETLDQRSMIGAALRNVSPAKLRPDLENAANEDDYIAMLKQIEKIDAQEGGEFLGGILKGAGPLFQKILQGLPMDGVDESLRTALEDMKSKLAPIPDEIVKAQLFGMVERSGGRIQKIEVVKALGAASVGQTFLCKMYGPNFPEEGKDVVVKLLKPDVRNRMMREKKVMLECAKNTDKSGGMEATYLGQLSRIEEELDLTIESRNVILGKIYDNSSIQGQDSDQVTSVKLESHVEPTVNAMMLEKAPGITVDQYKKDLALQREEREKRFLRTENEDLEEAMHRGFFGDTDEMNKRDIAYLERLFEERKGILAELKKLQKRQVYLVNLARKWVKEGIFGEGFYHGDLHAGNIMIDDEGATVIDFGNATKLTEEQQTHVTRMVAAAAAGDVEVYQEGLHALIKKDFEKTYQDKKEQLTRELKKVFKLGSPKSAGLRIAVSLLKAQELGIEVPSSIHNFSQCQLRLQNSIDDLISEMNDLSKQLSEMDEIIKETGQNKDRLKFDIFTDLLVSSSIGKMAAEEPKDVVGRERDDLSMRYWKIAFNDVEAQMNFFLSGMFYTGRLQKLEDNDGILTMDAAKEMIRVKLENLPGMLKDEMKEAEQEEQRLEELEQKFILNKSKDKTEKEKLEEEYEKMSSDDRIYIDNLRAYRESLVSTKAAEEYAKRKEEWEKLEKKEQRKWKAKVKSELRKKLNEDPEYIAKQKELKATRKKEKLKPKRQKLVEHIKSNVAPAFRKLEFAVSDGCKEVVESAVEKFVNEEMSTEDYERFLNGIEGYLKDKIENAKGVLAAYKKLEPVLSDGTKSRDEKTKACSEFLKDYQNIGAFYAAQGTMGLQSITLFRMFLRDQNKDINHKEAVRLTASRWAEEDKENEPTLQELIAGYNEHLAAHPDHPEERLAKEDEIVNRILMLTEKKMKPLMTGFEETADVEVKDFLNVMGETIQENMKTAFLRMGAKKAMEYRKIFQEQA